MIIKIDSEEKFLPIAQRLMWVSTECFPRSDWGMDTWKGFFGNYDFFVYINTTENQVSGFLAFYVVEKETEILKLGVLPEYRRRRIGSSLLNEMLLDLTRLEIKSIHLEVRRSNNIARSLYLSHGFVENGIRESYYNRPVDDAVLLTRKLYDEIS